MYKSKHGVITEFAKFSHDCVGNATLELLLALDARPIAFDQLRTFSVFDVGGGSC